MEAGSALQPLWDWVLRHVGVTGVASPAFLLTAVVAGVYLPGLVFSQGIGLVSGGSQGPAAIAGCDAVGAAGLNVADSTRLATISGRRSCRVRLIRHLAFRRAAGIRPTVIGAR